MTIREIVDAYLEDSRKAIIENMARDGMNASGSFSKSLRSETKEQGANITGILYGAPHSYFIDHGRGKTNTSQSGAKPLRVIIRKWIDDKGIVPNDKISKDSLAFLIARKIHREGWKPKNKYPNGVISSVINETSINNLSKEIGKISAHNLASEIFYGFTNSAR